MSGLPAKTGSPKKMMTAEQARAKSNEGIQLMEASRLAKVESILRAIDQNIESACRLGKLSLDFEFGRGEFSDLKFMETLLGRLKDLGYLISRGANRITIHWNT
jgi:hypothetical protein